MSDCNLGKRTTIRGLDLFALEFGMSSSENITAQSLELRVLNRNHGREISSDASSSSSTGERNHESMMHVNSKLVKLLDERLRILEDEGEILKGEFMRSMQERAQLIDEVRNHFEDMHYHFHLKRQECGFISSYGAVTIEPLKKERTGLLQVLCQESNPSVLPRTLSVQAGPC